MVKFKHLPNTYYLKTQTEDELDDGLFSYIYDYMGKDSHHYLFEALRKFPAIFRWRGEGKKREKKREKREKEREKKRKKKEKKKRKKRKKKRKEEKKEEEKIGRKTRKGDNEAYYSYQK